MPDRKTYEALGYATVPLQPGTKRPVKGQGKCWPDRKPADLWAKAPPDANLGLRCGDADLAVLDCDDFETAEFALRTLECLGLLDPTGSLTRRGMHLYIRTRAPDGFRVAPFAPPDWTGELRARRAYVVAPPSMVEGWTYRLVGDVGNVPVVLWRDIAHLVRSVDKATPCEGYRLTYSKSPYEGHVSSLTACVLPSGVLDLVGAIRAAPDGGEVKGYGRVYSSRSEGLCALWRRCLEAGLVPVQAAALVGPIAGRTLDELIADAERVYVKVLASRSAYGEIARQASAFTYPGRADAVRNQAKVLRAAARLAEQKGGGYLLHRAEIAKTAKVPDITARRSIERLVEAGYLVRGKRGKWAGFYVAVGHAYGHV